MSVLSRKILQTLWRIQAFLCNDIRLTEANQPIGSLPTLLPLAKEACGLNMKIKREKGQEKKERKLGGILAALDFIVYGGEPVVHQVTLSSEKCLGPLS